MKNAKKFGAFAAMAAAVVFAYSAAAENTVVDWSSVSGDVSGGTYTVPASTTVVVGDGDIAEVMTLTKVIFSSADSVMKFTTSTYPSNVAFQGPGTALFANKVVLTASVTVKRGDADEDSFVNFVFSEGITNATPETERKLTFNPSAFLNATVIFDGALETNVTCNPYPNRIEFGRNFSSESPRNISVGSSRQSVVRQLGGVIRPTVTDLSLSGGNGVGAYLLEGGTYYGTISGRSYCLYGSYPYLRQTGGHFSVGRLAANDNTGDGSGVRGDLVFGGSGTAVITGSSSPRRTLLFAFMDSIDFRVTYGGRHAFNNLYWATNSIWAYNGGIADFNYDTGWDPDTGNKSSAPTNSFHAFNGGIRRYGSGSSVYTEESTMKQSMFGWSPSIRVYENGGGIMMGNGTDTTMVMRNVEIFEPFGNVVKSIAISDELRNKVFQVPPSVEIWDEGGDGANAAAVVDYDFGTGKITNITVICKGENYSATTKANLRYKAGESNRLLTTPLDVTVGPEHGGDFAFCATNQMAKIFLASFTNHMHGALVIDMDREGLFDHKSDLGSAADVYNSLRLDDMGYNYGTQPHFPNCTNFILKSGLGFLPRMYGWNHSRIWPNCWRAELYGGHLSGGSLRMREIVLGGEVWLCTRYSANTNTYFGELRTTNDDNDKTPGTMIVDAAYGTSVVKYGHVDFLVNYDNTSEKSKITVKNWESIPKRRGWTTLLDLSETTVNGWARNGKVAVPDIAYPEGSEGELLIKWEMNPSDNTKPYKLLARRVVNGTVLIFR